MEDNSPTSSRSESPAFPCLVCQKDFPSLPELREHRHTVGHHVRLAKSWDGDGDGHLHACEFCDVAFAKLSDFTKHMGTDEHMYALENPGQKKSPEKKKKKKKKKREIDVLTVPTVPPPVPPGWTGPPLKAFWSSPMPFFDPSRPPPPAKPRQPLLGEHPGALFPQPSEPEGEPRQKRAHTDAEHRLCIDADGSGKSIAEIRISKFHETSTNPAKWGFYYEGDPQDLGSLSAEAMMELVTKARMYRDRRRLSLIASGKKKSKKKKKTTPSEPKQASSTRKFHNQKYGKAKAAAIKRLQASAKTLVQDPSILQPPLPSNPRHLVRLDGGFGSGRIPADAFRGGGRSPVPSAAERCEADSTSASPPVHRPKGTAAPASSALSVARKAGWQGSRKTHLLLHQHLHRERQRKRQEPQASSSNDETGPDTSKPSSEAPAPSSPTPWTSSKVPEVGPKAASLESALASISGMPNFLAQTTASHRPGLIKPRAEQASSGTTRWMLVDGLARKVPVAAAVDAVPIVRRLVGHSRFPREIVEEVVSEFHVERRVDAARTSPSGRRFSWFLQDGVAKKRYLDDEEAEWAADEVGGEDDDAVRALTPEPKEPPPLIDLGLEEEPSPIKAESAGEEDEGRPVPLPVAQAPIGLKAHLVPEPQEDVPSAEGSPSAPLYVVQVQAPTSLTLPPAAEPLPDANMATTSRDVTEPDTDRGLPVKTEESEETPQDKQSEPALENIADAILPGIGVEKTESPEPPAEAPDEAAEQSAEDLMAQSALEADQPGPSGASDDPDLHSLWSLCSEEGRLVESLAGTKAREALLAAELGCVRRERRETEAALSAVRRRRAELVSGPGAVVEEAPPPRKAPAQLRSLLLSKAGSGTSMTYLGALPSDGNLAAQLQALVSHNRPA